MDKNLKKDIYIHTWGHKRVWYNLVTKQLYIYTYKIHIYVYEWLYYTPETNITLQINYTSIKTLQLSVHVCMPSCFSCVQLFETPWTVAHQAPLSMGFSRQAYWSGLLWPPPGDLPDPGIEPESLESPAWPLIKGVTLAELLNPYLALISSWKHGDDITPSLLLWRWSEITWHST